MRTLSLLAVIAFLSPLERATAKEIKNEKFGFSCVVPDQFKDVKVAASDSNTLLKIVDQDPGPGKFPIAILIQRMNARVDKNQRMSQSELPVLNGGSATMEDFHWQGLTMDMMRLTMLLPTGDKFESYTIQYPLAEEAVQLQVCGFLAHDAEVRKIFDSVSSSFVNLQPLDDGEGRPLSVFERVERFASGLTKMAVTAIVLFLIGRAIVRSLRNRKQAAAPPPSEGV